MLSFRNNFIQSSKVKPPSAFFEITVNFGGVMKINGEMTNKLRSLKSICKTVFDVENKTVNSEGFAVSQSGASKRKLSDCRLAINKI